jgi:hypothetical protein
MTVAVNACALVYHMATSLYGCLQSSCQLDAQSTATNAQVESASDTTCIPAETWEAPSQHAREIASSSCA